MAETNLPAEGSFEAPPAGAPHEVAQPLTPEAIQQQLEMARRFEQVLPPFNPQASGPAPQGPTLTEVAQARNEARVLQADGQPYRPAESNTDSPSRGIPTPSVDPGKQITGGWGPALEAQYFPLDGLELKVLTERLLDQLREQIQNDLHFSIAITYPRVAVRLVLEVSGFTEMEGFRIQKGAAHDKTPEVVAAEAGIPFTETFVEQRAEFDEGGEPVDPPDRMRDSLNLPKPHKQLIDAGGEKMFVDVPTVQGSF